MIDNTCVEELLGKLKRVSTRHYFKLMIIYLFYLCLSLFSKNNIHAVKEWTISHWVWNRWPLSTLLWLPGCLELLLWMGRFGLLLQPSAFLAVMFPEWVSSVPRISEASIYLEDYFCFSYFLQGENIWGPSSWSTSFWSFWYFISSRPCWLRHT